MSSLDSGNFDIDDLIIPPAFLEDTPPIESYEDNHKDEGEGEELTRREDLGLMVDIQRSQGGGLNNVFTRGRVGIMDAISSPAPELEFVYGGMLKAVCGLLVAPGGVGKSTFAMQLLCDLAIGSDALRMGVKEKRKGMYITVEDPAVILQHRIHSIVGERYSSSEIEMINDAVSVHSLQGEMIEMINSKTMQRNDPLVANLIIAIEDADADIVFIDTFRRINNGLDENDSAAMTALTGVFDLIAAETGCAIQFIHHCNKTGRELDVMNINSVAGSGALTDNTRYVLSMAKLSESDAMFYGISDDEAGNYIVIGDAKVNFAAQVGKRFYRRESSGALTYVADMKKEKFKTITN
ncbi:AAA family ATPase [Vibrio astriarenae]